jgi:ribosome maturation factor RimP
MSIHNTDPLAQHVRSLLEASATAQEAYISGIEIVIEHSTQFLRIYIDNLDNTSMSMEKCITLNREFSAILDVDDPFPSAYTLEVSSPGLDRIIEVERDLQRFQNFHIRIKRKQYRSKLDGVLLGYTTEGIEVLTAIDTRIVPFADISQMRLHPTDEEIDLLITGAKNE